MDRSEQRDNMALSSDAEDLFVEDSISEESYIILDDAERDCAFSEALEGDVSVTLDETMPFPVDKNALLQENKKLREENEDLRNKLVDMQFKCMGMLSQTRGLQEKLELSKQHKDPLLRQLQMAEENRAQEMYAVRLELTETKKEKRGLSLEAIRLQNECQMTQNEMQSLRAENVQIQQESVALKQEIVRFQSETESLRKEKRERSYETIRLKNEITMLKKDTRCVKEDFEKLISKNTKLEKELKRARDDYRALQSDFDTLIDRQNNAAQDKENTRLELLSLVNAQQERIMVLETALTEEAYDLPV